MEKLDIEIPVSAGDQAYCTTSCCEIQTGTIKGTKVISEYYSCGNRKCNEVSITLTVNWGCTTEIYKLEDIGRKIFLTKKDLLKHLMEKL